MFPLFLFLLAVTDVELKRAKEATKAAVLMNLESRVCFSLIPYHTITMHPFRRLFLLCLLYLTSLVQLIIDLCTIINFFLIFFLSVPLVFPFYFVAGDCIRRYRQASFDIWGKVSNFFVELFFPHTMPLLGSK